MPKVFQAKAARDYPEHDIKKGDMYFHWSFFRGRKQMSKTKPRRSQTTGSPKLANILAVEEAFQDALDSSSCPDDVVQALTEAIDGADSSIDEYEDALSNLQDGFPNGCPAIDETEEARDNIQAWKDELESALTDVEGLSAGDYIDEDERKDGIKAELEMKLDRVPTDEEVSDVLGGLTFEWDDLTDEEQQGMLEAAQDAAQSISLEL